MNKEITISLISSILISIFLGGVMGLFFGVKVGIVWGILIWFVMLIVAMITDDSEKVQEETTNIVSPEMQMTDEEMKEANKEYE